MLRDIVEQKHYKFADRASDWREAIRMSCEVFEADRTVGTDYKEAIIRCVEEYGPYIVIMKDVAIPHSQECAEGVNKTAIAFMRLKEPVCFDPEDREMDARLFFTLASCNSSQHLANMRRLSTLLMNERAVEALLKSENVEDLLEIHKQFFE